MKKKNKIILIAIISVIALSIITVITYNLLTKSYTTKLSYSELFNKIENDDSFVLVISKSVCRYCSLYMPKIKKIANDYKIDIYYVEVDSFTADESSAFGNLIYYSATPTTVFITNGEETSKANRISGNASTEKIIEKLKVNNYIK